MQVHQLIVLVFDSVIYLLFYYQQHDVHFSADGTL